MSILIGIGGEFGSGKDSAADVLVEEFRFTRMKFADSLRRECWHALLSKEYPPEAPEDILFIIAQNTDPDLVYAKPTTPEMRRFLQWYGTDYRRSIDTDYWVKAAERSMSAERIVFTDVRFQNEADMIKRRGGRLWKVYSPGRTKSSRFTTHVSEQWVREFKKWDAVILNDGTLDELHQKVWDLAKCESEIQHARTAMAAPSTQSELECQLQWHSDWIHERNILQGYSG